MSGIFRAAFWLCIIITLTFAWMPHAPELLDNDKSQHELAFAVLCVTASLAYPLVRLFVIGLALSALGAIIEIVQSIPFLHRDCDIRDWYADTAAILITLTIVACVRAASRNRARQSNFL
jgi:VanZ family protein